SDDHASPDTLTEVTSYPAVGGIRHPTVTGVETSALPIVSVPGDRVSTPTFTDASPVCPEESTACNRTVYTPSATTAPESSRPSRSEERRVGKECTSQCAAGLSS